MKREVILYIASFFFFMFQKQKELGLVRMTIAGKSGAVCLVPIGPHPTPSFIQFFTIQYNIIYSISILYLYIIYLYHMFIFIFIYYLSYPSSFFSPLFPYPLLFFLFSYLFPSPFKFSFHFPICFHFHFIF